MFTVRKTSPTEWRAAVTRAASLVDASKVEALCLPSVFSRRVRLTVLRATGLVQVTSHPPRPDPTEKNDPSHRILLVQNARDRSFAGEKKT